jgi:hypothetical protein
MAPERKRRHILSLMLPPKPVREARLKPDFAHLYPGITPGEWLPARALSDQVLARVMDDPPPDDGLRHRVLSPEHFEFRDAPVTAQS